jgi:hypothetical protein
MHYTAAALLKTNGSYAYNNANAALLLASFYCKHLLTAAAATTAATTLELLPNASHKCIMKQVVKFYITFKCRRPAAAAAAATTTTAATLNRSPDAATTLPRPS